MKLAVGEDDRLLELNVFQRGRAHQMTSVDGDAPLLDDRNLSGIAQTFLVILIVWYSWATNSDQSATELT